MRIDKMDDQVGKWQGVHRVKGTASSFNATEMGMMQAFPLATSRVTQQRFSTASAQKYFVNLINIASALEMMESCGKTEQKSNALDWMLESKVKVPFPRKRKPSAVLNTAYLSKVVLL